jgi:hypothetical protein
MDCGHLGGWPERLVLLDGQRNEWRNVDDDGNGDGRDGTRPVAPW